MIQRDWFRRQFSVPVPVELLPNVLIRLRGTPARLEEILRPQPKERLVAKEQGHWSAQEHAGHLLDLEPLWLARLADYANKKEQLTAADLTNRKTHEADHDAHPVEQLLTGFRSARELLIDRAGQLDASCHDWAIRHPRLQTSMRLIDHLHFVAEHDDHHLAAIWDLL